VNAVERAEQALVEALTDACEEALKKAGYPPSEQLLDKISEEIRHSLTLK
jgi:uncharacterized protein YutE (UPF0331/DUF86 family)